MRNCQKKGTPQNIYEHEYDHLPTRGTPPKTCYYSYEQFTIRGILPPPLYKQWVRGGHRFSREANEEHLLPKWYINKRGTTPTMIKTKMRTCLKGVHPAKTCYYYHGGTIVNRTYVKHKNLYIYPFLPTIFGPVYYGPPVTIWAINETGYIFAPPPKKHLVRKGDTAFRGRPMKKTSHFFRYRVLICTKALAIILLLECVAWTWLINFRKLQLRLGGNPLKFQVVCSPNRTAVLKGFNS